MNEERHLTDRSTRARAFLFPLSQAARYSLQLPQNAAVVQNLLDGQVISYPPSPISEAGISELIDSTEDLQSTEVYAVLKQSGRLHQFTIGSGAENFLVLKGDPTEQEDICYINIVHCRLYPDPDSATVWFENPSTSVQCAQKIDLEREARTVTKAVLQPKEICVLQPGSWFVDLGTGLSFLLHISKRSDCDQHE